MMTGIFKARFLPAVMAIFLAGCSTLAPQYTRPDMPVASDWTDTAKVNPEEKPGQPLAQIPWRDYFVDAQLQKLIEQALDNNRDLRVAVLNIERSRAQYQIQRSDLFPKVDGTADATAKRVPEDFSGTGQAQVLHQYTVGIGVSSYELDLFGRVRSLKAQALDQYLATEQARRSVQISLIAQVATSYLNLAADKERLQLAEETLSSQQASYRLIKSRFDAGVASALELYQAQTSVDAARLDIARYTTLVAQDQNALTLVVGASPSADSLPTSLSERLTSLQEISPGLPSEVLLSRPDILQAEHVLRGANANIGAARAAFFPTITLTSSVGSGSSDLSGLFGSGSLSWNFVPRVTLPIFNAGSNRANLQVAKTDRDIAVAQYEKAIQVAFREVSDALALQATIEEQVSAQQSLKEATEQSYRLSQVRYEKGVDNYLNVLDSQRSLYGAEQSLITVRLSRLTNLVTFYKVLGGGGS